MTNNEWIELIIQEFDVTRTTAKEMLHAMYKVKARKSP